MKKYHCSDFINITFKCHSNRNVPRLFSRGVVVPRPPQMYASSPEAPFGAESLRWVDVMLSSARPVRSGQRVYYTGHVAGTEVGVRDYWIISSLEY